MGYLTTPKQITPQIEAFCVTFDGGNPPPQYVPVQSIPGEKLEDCHNVVRRQIETKGGSSISGWIIWEWPWCYLESEFHSIWVSPAGERIDVSPKRDGEKKILFLPAPGRAFTGERTLDDRKRVALRRHEVIDEFLRLAAALDRWMPPPGVQKPVDGEYRRIRQRMSQLGPILQRMTDVRRETRKKNR
jgi:hypothetical protein